MNGKAEAGLGTLSEVFISRELVGPLFIHQNVIKFSSKSVGKRMKKG
jgi:hypothetical protein